MRRDKGEVVTLIGQVEVEKLYLLTGNFVDGLVIYVILAVPNRTSIRINVGCFRIEVAPV